MLSFPLMPRDMKLVDPNTGTVAAKFLLWWNVDLKDFFDALQRSTSYATGLGVPEAEADGATAKVTIPDHTRVYFDGQVTVAGAVIDGLDYGQTYYAYYDDPARNGTSVNGIQVTTDSSLAVTSAANPYRHFIGEVTTPATSGDPPTQLAGVRPATTPPGFVIA